MIVITTKSSTSVKAPGLCLLISDLRLLPRIIGLILK